jgi:hypothetical protein
MGLTADEALSRRSAKCCFQAPFHDQGASQGLLTLALRAAPACLMAPAWPAGAETERLSSSTEGQLWYHPSQADRWLWGIGQSLTMTRQGGGLRCSSRSISSRSGASAKRMDAHSIRLDALPVSSLFPYRLLRRSRAASLCPAASWQSRSRIISLYSPCRSGRTFVTAPSAKMPLPRVISS